MPGLKPAQIDFLKEKGYLLLDPFLPEESYQLLVRELEEAIDLVTREAHSQGRINNLYQSEPFERRLVRLCEATGESKGIIRRYLGKANKSAGLFALLTHSTILNAVESVIGPEILVHPQFNLRAKMPGEPEVSWHQDIAFLDNEVEQTFMMNFWVPLVDTDVINGCLEIISESHCGKEFPHVMRRDQEIPEEFVPPGERVLCELSAGGAALFQHKTVHRSFENHSDNIRWSLDIRYSDSRLPTGRDRVPGFIARSKENPNSIARSHLDWLRLMEEA